MTPFRNRLRAQQGTAMIEMALVLPILLFLALGIVDFGRVMNYWNDTNQLAADGARYATVNKNPGADNADVADDDFRHWIRLQADTGELQNGTIAAQPLPDGTCPPDSTPSAPPGTCREVSAATPAGLRVCIGKPGQGSLTTGDLALGKPVEVVVETDYNLIPFLDRATQFGTVKIRGTAVMRLEHDYTMATGCTS